MGPITWIKTNAVMIMFSIMMAMTAGLAVLFNMWQGAQHTADTYKHVMEFQDHILTAQSNISQQAHQVDHVVERVTTRIMESPNANTLVPQDLADAYVAGLNSVRDAGAGPTNERHAVVP